MSDDWGTPDWIWSLFEEYHDPCPLGGAERCPDDLKGIWEYLGDGYYTRIFVNPPYSNPKPWVEKAIRTHQSGGVTIVMLLKHDSSTQWYRMLKEAGARFLMIEGRLTYKGPNSKPCAFPSVLAVLAELDSSIRREL